MTQVGWKTVYRSMPVRARADGDGPVEFVVSTEAPVGPFREVLLMEGADLSRFERNPLLLDSHDRSSIDSVIGRAPVRIEGGEMIARPEFADTERAQRAKSLVDGGFVNATSIGFRINFDSVVFVGEDAEHRGIRGPAEVVGEWELLEVSLVPVPADKNALRRSYFEQRRGNTMTVPAATPTPAEAPAGEAAPTGELAADGVTVDAVRAPVEDVPEIVAARRVVDAQIRDLATNLPEGKRDVAARLIMEGATLETARAEMLAVFREAHKPVGTTEPAEIVPPTPAETVSKDDLLRSLRSLNGR